MALISLALDLSENDSRFVTTGNNWHQLLQSERSAVGFIKMKGINF